MQHFVAKLYHKPQGAEIHCRATLKSMRYTSQKTAGRQLSSSTCRVSIGSSKRSSPVHDGIGPLQYQPNRPQNRISQPRRPATDTGSPKPFAMGVTLRLRTNWSCPGKTPGTVHSRLRKGRSNGVLMIRACREPATKQNRVSHKGLGRLIRKNQGTGAISTRLYRLRSFPRDFIARIAGGRTKSECPMLKSQESEQSCPRKAVIAGAWADFVVGLGIEYDTCL